MRIVVPAYHVPVVANYISRAPYVICPKDALVLNRYDVGTPKETADVLFYTLYAGGGIHMHRVKDVSDINTINVYA